MRFFWVIFFLTICSCSDKKKECFNYVKRFNDKASKMSFVTNVNGCNITSQYRTPKYNAIMQSSPKNFDVVKLNEAINEFRKGTSYYIEINKPNQFLVGLDYSKSTLMELCLESALYNNLTLVVNHDSIKSPLIQVFRSPNDSLNYCASILFDLPDNENTNKKLLLNSYSKGSNNYLVISEVFKSDLVKINE